MEKEKEETLEEEELEEEELSPEEMPLEIRVLLDREVYFVGQEICGVVEIVNEHRRRMRGIRLTLRCRSEVVWWEVNRTLMGKGTESKHVNDDDLMYSEKYIVGDGKTMCLEPGLHQFPFSIALKSKKKKFKLPSSMEFPKGHIRYFVKAELDWPWASALEHERLVTVIGVCNLHDIEEALHPATFTKTFKVGLSQKKIHMAGILEKLGYVPGEEILLHVDIDNASNKRIDNFSVEFVEVVRYLASDGKQQMSRHVLVSNDYGPIAQKSNMVKTKESLLVPAVPQSAEAHVEFMKVTYEVSIVVLVGGSKQSVSNRIIIGTLPTKAAYIRFHKGIHPPKSVCVWPFAHLDKVPCPLICPQPQNPETDWEKVVGVDPDFVLQNVCFAFDREKAIATFDDESDEESAEDGDEMERQLSEFSL